MKRPGRGSAPAARRGSWPRCRWAAITVPSGSVTRVGRFSASYCELAVKTSAISSAGSAAAWMAATSGWPAARSSRVVSCSPWRGRVPRTGIALEVQLRHPHHAGLVEDLMRGAEQVELLRIREAVAVDDVVEQDLGPARLPGRRCSTGRCSTSYSARNSRPCSSQVLTSAPSTFWKRPAAPLLGALADDGRAGHADEAAGHLPLLLVEQLGEAAGQVALRAHRGRLAAAVVGDRVDGPAQAVEVDHARRVRVLGGEPGGAALRVVQRLGLRGGSGLPRSAYQWLCLTVSLASNTCCIQGVELDPGERAVREQRCGCCGRPGRSRGPA